VPYTRGDLVARAHREGELETVEHLEAGTRLVGRVNEPLAGDLVAAAAPASA
jgi:GTP-binding protein HflX